MRGSTFAPTRDAIRELHGPGNTWIAGSVAPLQALHGEDGDPDGQRESVGERSETKPASGRLLCRTCSQHVSEPRARFVMTGDRFVAVFANPHGRVFEIVTLRYAEGLRPVGGPTEEHTWFPGYAWSVVLCAGCLTHLGWSFVATGSREPRVFHGLLVSELVEEREDD